MTATATQVAPTTDLLPGKVLLLKTKPGAPAKTLAVDPPPVVTISVGGHRRYCLQFGGAQKWKADVQFRAADAAAPPACLP